MSSAIERPHVVGNLRKLYAEETGQSISGQARWGYAGRLWKLGDSGDTWDSLGSAWKLTNAPGNSPPRVAEQEKLGAILRDTISGTQEGQSPELAEKMLQVMERRLDAFRADLAKFAIAQCACWLAN
jgi:hypothetical protein